MILYKYRAINKNTIELAKNGKAWFARVTSLNDPFEGDFAFSEKLTSQISKQVNSDTGAKNECGVDLAKQIRFSMRRKRCILSLSKTNSDILLWSHYANEHKGVCIGIDINGKRADSTFVKNLNGSILHKVKYSDDPIIIGDYSTNSMASVLTQKSRQWKYEKEYRLITEDSSLGGCGIPIDFDPKVIREVTFGALVPDSAIDDCIKEIGRDDIEYRRAIIVHGHFTISSIGI